MANLWKKRTPPKPLYFDSLNDDGEKKKFEKNFVRKYIFVVIFRFSNVRNVDQR